MTSKPGPQRSSEAKRKPASASDRMTAGEEKAVARAFQQVREGKCRTYRDADEYLKYLDTA